MISRKKATLLRKAHRYLGLFLGVQFLFWTISGLYFSWTNLDEIHGDQFKNLESKKEQFQNLVAIDNFEGVKKVYSMELISIGEVPFFWVNDSILINARTGRPKAQITKEEALQVAKSNMKPNLKVTSINRIDSVGPHSEYRERPLPAYQISYETPENLKAYVAVESGKFQTVRHRSWRWFDFLWMTHTMDYQGRDNFNTTLLRIFSLAGLITVLSGFLLWGTSSPTIRKLFKKKMG